MNIPIEFLLIASSVGAVQSGSLSVYLLSQPKKKELSTRILGFLLLALAVRMAKSCAWYFSHDNLPAVIENIGYAANLAIAPLLFLYAKGFVNAHFEFKKVYLFHFIPTFLTLAFSLLLDDWFWLGSFYGYLLSILFFGGYFPFIYLLLIESRFVSKEDRRWIVFLTVGINLVWAAYAANFLFGLVSYITAPAVFSLVIYSISFLALKQNKFLNSSEKYQYSKLTETQIENYAHRIEDLIRSKKIYKDPSLTLPVIARHVGISTQAASEAINRYFGLSFTEFINSFRIVEARHMLQDPKNFEKKIASIAYECGYGTLSAFNTTFKKHTGLTPSQYKRTVGTRHK